MSHSTIEVALRPRQLLARPGPVPELRLSSLVTKRAVSLVARSSDSSSCDANDTSGPCTRYNTAQNSTTVPIALGVVIPLTIAFVLLIVLHRRHVRKLRQEDMEDKHKSLDFGMDGTETGEKRGKRAGNPRRHPAPEMSSRDAQTAVRRDRGVSLDMNVPNPYLLPPELQQSRESLHSLSRSLNNEDDKYRATNFIPDDGSLRSPSLRSRYDDASSFTGSGKPRYDSESSKGLIPPSHAVKINEPLPSITRPGLPAAKASSSLLAPNDDPSRDSYMSTASSNANVTALRASNNYLGAFISGGNRDKNTDSSKSSKDVQTTVTELPGDSPVEQSHAAPVEIGEGKPRERESVMPEHAAAFDFNLTPASPESKKNAVAQPVELPVPQIREPEVHQEQPQAPQPDPLAQPTRRPRPQNDQPVSRSGEADHDYESDYYDDNVEEDENDLSNYQDVLGYDPKLLAMGMRPLPPDDPTESSEQRAIRIRSFYKEYFDETGKPGGAEKRVSYFDGSENYIDDYYGSYEPQSAYSSRGPSMMPGQQGRFRAYSSGGYMSGAPGPRAYSSQSARYNRGVGGRPLPKKNRPPPAPLQSLPTPHKLKDDSMLPNAIDYAPPQMFKNQRAGTPDNLRGGLRPYSPSTRAYNPLVSSFDDLSVLPSPHQLRKSGAFTTLDFAPPRFVGATGGSDAGSIRSNQSGMSQKQLHNIRAGAYRLSRIPKEVAGTKNELASALKPQWGMRA